MLYRERRGPPGLEAALNIGRAGEPELLQHGGCQAGLVALVAPQDDVIVEVRCMGVAVLACRVKPPFEDVPGDVIYDCRKTDSSWCRAGKKS